MIDQLRAMAVFAKTVECGSFRGAARKLRLSPSVVSHHVAQLEVSLGVALLYRTTRRIALTDDGEQLYRAASAMVAAAEQGLGRAASAADEPSGSLTVTAPAVLMPGPLTEDLAAFSRAYPRVSLTIRSTDATISLIEEGVDLAIRASTRLEDSALKCRKLFTMPRVLVASPVYLASKGAPLAPDELASWDWIRLSSRPPSARFTRQGHRGHVVPFTSRVTVDSGQVMLDLARNGLGLAAVPAAAAAPFIALGGLVEVLPAWRLEPAGVYAVWPPNVPKLGLARRLVDMLARRQKERSDGA